MKNVTRICKSLLNASLVLSLVCAAGYSADCTATQPLGARGWFASAMQDAGKAQLTTPTVATATGPATTSSFQKANSALIVNGNQTKTEVDFQTHGLYPFGVVRTYNRQFAVSALFDNGWASNFDIRVNPIPNGSTYFGVTAVLADGSQVTYSYSGPDPNGGTDFRNSSSDADSYAVRNPDGTWSVIFNSGAVEVYAASGTVESTRDPTGIGLNFSYDTSGRLQQVTHTDGQIITIGHNGSSILASWIKDPGGNVYNYNYSSVGMLTSVTYPNGDVRTYTYENSSSAQAGLTSISINNKQASAYTYNSNKTVATSGLLDGSLDQATFSYGNLVTTVTNGNGAATTYTYALVNGLPKIVQVAQNGVTNSPNTTASYTYDAAGHVQTFTDPKGIGTNFQYSSDGLIQDEITGIDPNNPGDTRETKTEWDHVKRRMTKVSIYGPNTSPIAQVVYNWEPDTSSAKNRLASVVATNLSSNGVVNQTQTVSYSYQFYGSGMPSQISSNGPSGVATDNFDTAGNLTSAVDGMGNITSYSGYSGLGLPTSTSDPNGYTVSYGYDALGRVTSSTRTLDGVTATTSVIYDPTNQVGRINYPDGGWILMNYDGVGNLTSKKTDISQGTTVTSKQSSVATYAWESLGYNNTGELGDLAINSEVDDAEKEDTQWVTTYTVTKPYHHAFLYDSIGRKTGELNSAGVQILHYTYDADGNVATQTDALNHTWTYAYNAHNQLSKVTDPLNNITQFSHDGAGNLSSVIDSKGNVTDYYYDGFGNLTAETSPDSGVTSYQYDSLGRITQLTRADGTITSYRNYDVLNRPGQIQAGSQTINYGYDTCTNGKARLCSVTDSSGSTNFAYRQNGQTSNQVSVVGGTGYGTSFAYDNRERLSSITYPGGNKVSYSYNTQSHVSNITATIGGTVSTVASASSFSAFDLGPRTSVTLGDSKPIYRNYDGDYRLSSLSAWPIQSLSYIYDNNNSLTKITNAINTNLTQTYGYDALLRLNSVTAGIGNQGITFDANSTRTGYTWGGANDAYTPDNYSNRISSISGSRARTFGYDSLGNVTTLNGWGGNRTFGFDSFNRMTTVNNGGSITNYSYNAFNQRVKKTGPSGTYGYIFTSDGTLLGETSNGGTSLTTQYVYLEGQPIALIRNGALYYIHSDHIGRPDTVTNSSALVVWQASNTAFDRAVTTDTFGGLNVGFPGQYYDSESGLYYNFNRFYDPTTGRYISSDPIGLRGGLNTYAYVGGNPPTYIDPTGTFGFVGLAIGVVSGGAAGYLAGNWTGAIIGGVVGGAVGIFAPFASAQLGALVGGSASALVTAATYSAFGALSAASATVVTNKYEGKPITDDLAFSTTLGALAPLVSGEAFFVAAGGAEKLGLSPLADYAYSSITGSIGVVGTAMDPNSEHGFSSGSQEGGAVRSDTYVQIGGGPGQDTNSGTIIVGVPYCAPGTDCGNLH